MTKIVSIPWDLNSDNGPSCHFIECRKTAYKDCFGKDGNKEVTIQFRMIPAFPISSIRYRITKHWIMIKRIVDEATIVVKTRAKIIPCQ